LIPIACDAQAFPIEYDVSATNDVGLAEFDSYFAYPDVTLHRTKIIKTWTSYQEKSEAVRVELVTLLPPGPPRRLKTMLLRKPTSVDWLGRLIHKPSCECFFCQVVLALFSREK
jgi:hypothetical protein